MDNELIVIVMIISSVLTFSIICLIRFGWLHWKHKKNNQSQSKTEYDAYLDELYQTIKDKGQLVKVMEKTDSFLLNSFDCYKKNLGAVPIRDKYGNYSHVYVVYEDFDGSIKYYDYPQ